MWASCRQGDARVVAHSCNPGSHRVLREGVSEPKIDVGPGYRAYFTEAWLIEAPEDAAGIARALGDIARAVGMSKVAKQSGLSRESLYKTLSEDGNPSLDTILRVARAVGVRFHASAA